MTNLPLDFNPPRIHLDTPVHCRMEMERCSTGLVWLDHAFTACRDAQGPAEENAARETARAAAGARQSSSDTATEIKGRTARMVEEDPEAKKAVAELHQLQSDLAKIDRWFKSLEKRLGAAQSANKQHEKAERGERQF